MDKQRHLLSSSGSDCERFQNEQEQNKLIVDAPIHVCTLATQTMNLEKLRDRNQQSY